jgi:hypothetical protein
MPIIQKLDLERLSRKNLSLLLNTPEKTISIWVDTQNLPVHDQDATRPYYVWKEVLTWRLEKLRSETTSKLERYIPTEGTSKESMEELRKEGVRKDNFLKQIDIDEKLKVLLPADMVEDVWAKAIVEAKTKLLSLPSVLAPRLSGLEQKEIQKELLKYMENALSNLNVSCLDDINEDDYE